MQTIPQMIPSASFAGAPQDVPQTVPWYPTQTWMQPVAPMPVATGSNCSCRCKQCQSQQARLQEPQVSEELRRRGSSRPRVMRRVVPRRVVPRRAVPVGRVHRPGRPTGRQPIDWRRAMGWRWPIDWRWPPHWRGPVDWSWPLGGSPVPVPATADLPSSASPPVESGPAVSGPAVMPQQPVSTVGGCGVPSELQRAEQIALGLTTFFETGRSYACRVSPTSDPDGISMGMIQWNLRARTLQSMIAAFERQGGNLQRHFGSLTGRLRSLLAMPQGSRADLDRMIEQSRVARREAPEAWNNALLSLCADPIFCRLQVANIRGRMRDARQATERLGLTSVRGLAMLFDIQVGDGYAARVGDRMVAGQKIVHFGNRISQEQSRLGRSMSEREKLVLIAREAAGFAGRWSQERLDRRMVIAQGTGRYRRSNWDLSRQFPQLDQPHGLQVPAAR